MIAAPFKWKHAPKPSEPDAIKILDDWALYNISYFACEPLARATGGVYRMVTMARKVKADFLALWAAWERDESLYLLQAHARKLNHPFQPNGFWAARYKRGAPHDQNAAHLSNHCLGTAFDLCAAAYPLGFRPPPDDPIHQLVWTAEQHNFVWGGNFLHRPDPMHWEHKSSLF